MKAVVLTFALVFASLPTLAQTDARWDPWLGCWQLSTDNVRAGAPAAGRLVDAPRDARLPAGAAPRVCVTPADGGARVETSVRGQDVVAQTIVADATERPMEQDGCRGTQRAEWSADGLRFFSHADLTCEGESAPRRLSGVSLLGPNGTWLDIQAIESATGQSVRVRRYVRASGGQVPAATVVASRLGLDDIKEAHAKIPPRALEAALVETNSGFDLTSERVLDLDAAGVSDSVIDLLVALSYPERFVVERRSGGSGGSTFFNDPFGVGWAFGYPVWYDDYYYSPYYSSPFAYGGQRFYAPYGIVGGGVIVPAEAQPSGLGRVVDGQGYTRIREREAANAEPVSASGTRSTASTSGPSGGGGSSSSGTASSGGGDSGGGSSGSSGGGGDTGRTAVPR